MNCIFRKFILSLVFSNYYFFSFCQVNDAGLWSSLSIEKKFSDKVSASLSEEFRFNENISELSSFFTDAGIAFKFNDDVKISGCYRFISKRKTEDYYSFRHRIYFDIVFRRKIKKLTPAIRLRLQEQQTDIYSSDAGKIPEWYLRPKISFRYNLKGKFTPYLASEFFYHFAGKVFDNARNTVGVERKINNKLDLDLFFLHQREFNVDNPTYDYIWGIGLNYSL